MQLPAHIGENHHLDPCCSDPEKSFELVLSEEVLDGLLDDVLVEDCLIGFLELEAVLLVAQNWQVSKLLVLLVKEGRS